MAILLLSVGFFYIGKIATMFRKVFTVLVNIIEMYRKMCFSILIMHNSVKRVEEIGL